MGTYAYSGNQNKQRDNHADEYLPDLLNDIQDEIEIVEQVLSGGEEGQVLTADSAGKAQWTDSLNDIQDMLEAVGKVLSGGVIYDEVEISNILANGVNTTTVTFLINGEQITKMAWFVYKATNEADYSFKVVEDGTVDIETVDSGGTGYGIYFFFTNGEVRILDLEPPGGGIPD